MIKPLQHDSLSAPHGFFTREGGVSKGLYAGLNAGLNTGGRSDDNPAHVAANRQLICDYFDGTPSRTLCTNFQTHSAVVTTITPQKMHETMHETAHQAPSQADALVTKHPHFILGILTADCAPILFEDAQNRVIGAAHAGWKGAFSGIIENTLTAMLNLGAQKECIAAVIGPCISADAYEVGAEFKQRFLEQNLGGSLGGSLGGAEENERFFSPSLKTGALNTEKSENHFMFDLSRYIMARLETSGIGSISQLNNCTYQDESRFFSYRRATHRQETDYGRQLSAICLNQL